MAVHVQDKTEGRKRHGRWLPHQAQLEEWLEKICKNVEAKEKKPLHPVIEEFRALIQRDPIVRLYVTEMVEQVPHTRNYRKRHLKDVNHMLRVMDEVISQAPEYNVAGAVACPLNAVFDWSCGTHAAYAAFRLDAMNDMLRKILRTWCEFLSSPASLHVLNDSPHGWKCEHAQKAVKMDQFQYDPDEEHWGFKSWNDYFTRRFKEGQRPIAEPDNDKVIINGCESTPYAIKPNAVKEDRFWIKNQPYSLQDMLANDESADEFVGGTVFQAFLDAHNYHRWHSPVAGTIRKAWVKNGTYFSEAEADAEDPEGPEGSQGYLAHVATRAIILIECRDPTIGLVCIMPVGMGDVSSCIIDPKIKPGQQVAKGEELGHFQFGGSTYCMIFRKGAIKQFAIEALPQTDNPDAPWLLMGMPLAYAN